VTAAFSGVPLQDGLRRLTGQHEVVLVFRARPRDRDEPDLVEVRVFAGLPATGASRGTAASSEVERLLRSGPLADNAPRLAALAGSASDSGVRARAIWALSRIGGPEAEGQLARALGDQSPMVRVQAVEALRRVSGVRAVPAIQAVLLGDGDASVRRAAARALGMLRAEPATSALNAAAHDPDPLVRQEVARALRRHGVTASP
jgi:HEAT repeat protein